MASDDELDFVELQNFKFQPDWATKPSKFESDGHELGNLDSDPRKRSSYENGKKYKSDRNSVNFHEGGSNFHRKKRFSGENGKFNGKNGDKNLQNSTFVRHEFVPIIEANFYPDEAYFNTAISAFKLTCKTYTLFTVARLFLEKPERFVVVIKKTDTQEDKNLYLADDDDFVFASEQDAINHVLDNHIEKYFNITEEETKVPTGNFTCIHKCGFTGKLLCPPNYHRYQEILLEHHTECLPHMAFSRFKERIENIFDQAAIDEWKLSASKIKVYVPKVDGCSERLVKIFGVRRFFTENFKEKAIKISDSFRITGTAFSNMPRGVLSKSIFTLLLQEKKFPLKFANNLRGKLRHAKFTIYKTKTKKITYVCAVKRRFRSIEDNFEDEIQALIDFIDANPGTKSFEIYKRMNPEATDVAEGNGNVKFSSFIKNLTWLIREGYVSEFEDSSLTAAAALTQEQLEAMKKFNHGDKEQTINKTSSKKDNSEKLQAVESKEIYETNDQSVGEIYRDPQNNEIEWKSESEELPEENFNAEATLEANGIEKLIEANTDNVSHSSEEQNFEKNFTEADQPETSFEFNGEQPFVLIEEIADKV